MTSNIMEDFTIIDRKDFADIPKPFLFFIHGIIFSELIEILHVLLTDASPFWVKNGYNASLIIDRYKRLFDLWGRLYRYLGVQKLQIRQFKEFYELETNLPYSIRMWELSKLNYIEDKRLLERLLGQPYPMPEDLQNLIEETEQILNIYQNQKEYLLELSDDEKTYVFYYLIFNYQQGSYLYKNKIKEFQPGIHEFQFLEILLNNRGKVITYGEIYKLLNKKQIATLEPKDEIKNIRKNLRKQFISLNISSMETDFMLSKIVAKTNLGYILS